MIPADVDIRHPERFNPGEEISDLGLLDPTEVDDVSGVDHGRDVLLVHDLLDERVVIDAVQVGYQQESRRWGCI
ncbi:hypothetical protein L0A91_14185 [Ornithinimicrobium sp. INDO-MA30-4]|nr:hypothetical protein [Ornithinimicrobium sp. INDO-MA30-4]UJH70278.1 hypothetical protein L0A91_14185 [Ornithinimicrobium sp. INDO-MA30-4]